MQQPYNGNPYNNPYGYSEHYAYLNSLAEKRRTEKSAIRKLGTCTGCAILLYIALQNVYSIVISLLGFGEFYLGSQLIQGGIDILFIIFSILPSFMLFGIKMKKISGASNPVNLAKPRAGLTALAFFAGMAACMVANYVTAFFSAIMLLFGYELSSPDVGLPMGPAGIVTTVVQIAVVAALVEEICMRGYVMGNLRKYGDGFAVLVSSIIFALIHGNLVQAPFALIVGLALGYFSVKTESLWTGILIHAGNNLFSVVLSYIGEYFSDQVLAAVYTALTGFFFFFGIACFAAFLYFTKNKNKKSSASSLTGNEKLLAFVSSPAIIAVVIIMLFITASYIAPVEIADPAATVS